uniref:Methyltransferase domain-containing protein n=1 Tax=Acrobeloides nanus TaxID=290746 RepID=A0A914DI28_9BILA
MFLFFMTELLFGISGGAGSVAKTQIVMASTEIERPKAMGIIQVGGFVGMVIGPMLQIAFMGLGYPGADFIFGTRLNLYTVPILLTFGVSIIGIILLIFFFDGKMRIRKKEVLFEKVSTISSDGSKDNLEISNESESTFNTNDQHIGYDKIAAIICIITSTLVGVMMLVLSTVLPPFAMMVFNWTSEDMILYQAIGMILVGICIILDVGCGTGRMGSLLLQHGYNNLDGHDGSEQMLEIAKQKRMYQNLYCEIFVPGKPSKIPSESYDGMVTVGTFAPGHLNSDHVPEMLRILKKGGRLVIGTRKQWLTFPGDEYKWNYDLESEFKKLEQEGQWKLLEKKFKNDYCPGVEGTYLIYEKL